MRGYGQFCPVAKASEIFAERWTPLIMRDGTVIVDGPRDLKRAFPQWNGVSHFARYGVPTPAAGTAPSK